MLRSAISISLLAAICTLTPHTAAGQSSVPLCAGLTIVGAVSEPKGDYEPIVTVESIDRNAVNLKYSAQVETPGSIRNIVVHRTVLLRDMASARLVVNWYSIDAPRTLPGTTAYGASGAVLRALKSKGEADLGLVDRGNSTLPADRSRHPNIFDAEHVFRVHRVGPGPVSMPVIVNDARVNVPAIHAQGEFMGDKGDWLFLDDETNPIGLQFRLTPLSGAPTLTRVVKISHHCSEAAATASRHAMSQLEKSLLDNRKADVYQIYFDFNSDVIREESEPTLREIGDILNRHGDWKLTINGHTDNVGGDAFNLDLSRRRAVSVRNALVARYRIDTRRLSTGGAGASQPKDTNTTLEGRAHNRRVELVRT